MAETSRLALNVLKATGLYSDEALARIAEQRAANPGMGLAEATVKFGGVKEAEFLQKVGEFLGFDYIDLEKAGVFFCDRETVNMTEKMKVTTCLNPLHTAMSVYGCLLGYTLICEEMKDEEIVKLVKRLGYVEGLPVVVDPKILSPKAFIDEVVNERLPNPFMPDDPRRIATDTSQKVGIRFGETIKSYIKEGRDLGGLVAIPLAIAGWLRYLNGTFDDGKPMEVSPDPLKDELMAKVKAGEIREILSNASIFGLDLTTTPIADKVEGYYRRLLEGPGSARRLLKEELA